jgi:hypothetical protein
MARGGISVRAAKVILRDTEALLAKIVAEIEQVNAALEAACGEDLFQMRQRISAQDEWDMELYTLVDSLDSRLTDLRVKLDSYPDFLETHRQRIQEFGQIPTPAEDEPTREEREHRDSLLRRIRNQVGDEHARPWGG